MSVAVNQRKSQSELKRQIEANRRSVGFVGREGVESSPVIESSTGRLDILSADRNSGVASSGFDDALIDELGLLART